MKHILIAIIWNKKKMYLFTKIYFICPSVDSRDKIEPIVALKQSIFVVCVVILFKSSINLFMG